MKELLKGNKELVLKTCKFYGSFDPFGDAIWSFFESHGKLVEFFEILVEAELVQESSEFPLCSTLRF